MFDSKNQNTTSFDEQEVDTRQFSSPENCVTSMLITFFINCFIAVFLYGIGYVDSLWFSFLLSHVIGFSISATIHLLLFLVRPQRYARLYPTVGIGLFCGLLIALFFIRIFFDIPFNFALVGQLFFLGVSFGSVISLFFIIRKKLHETRSRLKDAQIKALTNKKNALEARLKLLQAQIEPHFLFNTLANIEGLLENDVETARSMLNNLTSYLRASLKKSRKTRISLNEELEMVRAYLEIFQIRMGKRLHYGIEIDEGAGAVSVPPMLIQPLVENAILHGLEPKIEGGEILVKVRRSQETIHLEVSDTGPGLADSGKQGLGLANVRERLDIYYDGGATMEVRENHPAGVRVIMEVPCSIPQS